VVYYTLLLLLFWATGSVFKVSTGANQNNISIDSTAIKLSQGFSVTAPLTHINGLSSSISLNLSADDAGTLATYSQASLNLYSNSSASYITLAATDNSRLIKYNCTTCNGTTTNGSIISYLNGWDGNIGIIEIVDDGANPHVFLVQILQIII
jgi:hypothetical protein